jgi:MOSC domain-containing protein YiiM
MPPTYAFNSASSLARLLNGPVRPGRVGWIGVRPARAQPMRPLERVSLDTDEGVTGDRYKSRGQRTRQVTLIEAESLAAIAAFLALPTVAPEQVRRNVVVSGINLLALKGRRFRLGEAELEYTGECHPCSRMEETLGPGGYNAMRGRGGITARVLVSGDVAWGDEVRLLD